MCKLNFTTVLVASLLALAGYLTLHPTAARTITDWLRRMAGLDGQLTMTQSLPPLNYQQYQYRTLEQ
jgi:hypothetical protein